MKVYEGEVKFLRLNNGEDIIGQIFSDDTGITIRNPLKILYLTAPSSPNRLSISLMQWVFSRISSEQTFDLDKKDILMISDANENLVKYYFETVEHFESIKERIDEAVRYQNNEEPEFDDEEMDIDFQEAVDPEEGLNMLNEFLNSIKRDPKKLN